MQQTTGKRFGDDAYAAEEPPSPNGAAFSAYCLIDGELRTQGYLASWPGAPRTDKRARIFVAATGGPASRGSPSACLQPAGTEVLAA